MADSYQVAPIFLIRMAGAPFEMVERLATRATSEAARTLLFTRDEMRRAHAEAERLLAVRDNGLSAAAFHSLRAALRTKISPAVLEGAQSAGFVAYAVAAHEMAQAELKLKNTIDLELTSSRQLLHHAARTILPRYLVFAAGGVHDLLAQSLSEEGVSISVRNKRARERERHLLLYLQRIAAKNDTFSEFGPSAWGVVSSVPGVTFSPRPGFAKRDAFLERWTAHALAAALNSDPEVRPELSPRLNPNGRIEGDSFVFAERGDAIALEPSTRDALKRCDGQTPAHSLAIGLETLEALAEQDVVRWEVEVPAMEAHAFAVLAEDVAGWRAGAARERWMQIIQPVAGLAGKFASQWDTAERKKILEEATEDMQTLGASRRVGQRSLYAAINPIGEECFREAQFAINEQLLNEVATEAALWIDFWRDTYAFVASRVASGLRRLFESAPGQNGTLPLPAFLKHCEAMKLSLTGPGMVAMAHLAFQEVKTVFLARLRNQSSQAEYELTEEDCHVVRRNFQYETFDEYTYPSADLQIAAESVEAVARGDYRWILGELHPPAALLHHGGYWSCPDKPALTRALMSTIAGRPTFHFGFFAADFTSHTTVRLFDAIPEMANFVAPQRGNSRWRTVAPADAEVYVEETSGDVCLRKIGSHEHLGSFARAWLIPLGFHPFQFGLMPHTPRLRCGKVIVQRRSWAVGHEELGPGDFTGVSRDLVLSIERLRAEKEWPRFVYIRPTEQALRRSGAEGRDKDTKPVFIDLESYLFLEIFHRWLMKSGELEVTEMLPAPDQLFWKEPDGRRTFELRTLIVPKE